MKKRPYLLIEALIALTLLTVCAVPLVKQPLKLYKEEIAFLHAMELERLADWTFTEIEEMFLKNEIPWDQIPTLHVKSDPFPLSDATIRVPGCEPKQVVRSFTLTGRGEKTCANNEQYRQIWIHIKLNKNYYWFRLPIQKLK
jgi:hypothetical protein